MNDIRSSLQTGAQVRRACREGTITGQTSGLAPGFAQANLVILREQDASQFLEFCQKNPKPCPLLEVTKAGDPGPHQLAKNADLRTDLPRYRVWKHGELVEEPTDINHLWQDDLVSFLIGCSFTFESALIEAGLSVRHVDLGVNVPMYRTTIACESAGIFSGPLVVSMRPFKPADAIRAVQITGQFPAVHGAPVHLGFPEQLGITNLAQPDFGEAVPVEPGELPVFWACGVTPQAVLMQAKPEFAITHSPGCMFVSDLKDEDLKVS
ncbi:putative hydro-lyase [uncultured Gimesia sp.]|uniref:putative hydro-lyase n=1 Tax=uncultured Gimesia sp. TaxID=1678688 RepID=UPI0030D7ECD1|tara:strand:+ start:19825 stop:20622 length:798 start_codon:yes stop_codon:yes gene_type:complete